jgi:hypothetical protein
LEFKAVKSRQIARMGIHNLNDLTKISPMQLCGEKLCQIARNIVFKDNSIDIGKMTWNEEKHYLKMKDPYEWTQYKGHKTANDWKKEMKFRAIVKKYGLKDLSRYLEQTVREKANLLKDEKERFSHLDYNVNSFPLSVTTN